MALRATLSVAGSPDDALASLATAVEVVERMGCTTTWALRVPVGLAHPGSPELGPVATDAYATALGPGASLRVGVTEPESGGAHVLVDGPVHGEHIHLAHGGEGSFVEIRGSDRSVEMDRDLRSVVHQGAEQAVVSGILGGYSFVPQVDLSATHSEQKHVLVQRETDLAFVRRLARRAGRLFWLRSDQRLGHVANVARPDAGERARKALTIHGQRTVLTSLDIEWDVERPSAVESRQLDLNSKRELDGAAQGPLSFLGRRDLQSVAGGARTTSLAVPCDDAGALKARSEAALIDAGWFVRARGELTAGAWGAVLRAHQVVELSGAGPRHDGDWYVAEVRHLIDHTTHRMAVQLVRNAWSR